MILGVPYDAEIEYLESTGTQWVDTGIDAGVNTRSETDLEVTNWDATAYSLCGVTGTSRHAFGKAYSGSSTASSGNNTYLYFGLGGRNYVTTVKLSTLKNVRHVYFVDATSRTAGYDNISFSIGGVGTLTNNGYSALLLAQSQGPSNTRGQMAAKLYRCKYYESGVLVRDFIPVRVGQTGYMYDRVTKRLFGNKGTGSFVLGPDVAKPVMGLWGMRKVYTADDYIKDGLVAMWDGIENAGRGQWGKNNPNATDWPALVGGNTWGTGANIKYNATGHYYDTNKVGSATALRFVPDVGVPSVGSALEFVVCGTFATADYRNGITVPGGTLIDIGTTEFRGHYPGSSVTANASLYTPMLVTLCNKGVYKNGQYLRNATVPSATYTYLSSPGNSANHVSLNIYAIRLYNRALSPAEIAHNYAIDKARFNLP